VGAMGLRSRVIGLAIAGSSIVIAAAIAAPTQIHVYNDSNFAMVELKARPHQAKAWPYTLLGKYSLGVGRSQTVAPPSGQACVYDFLATFDDGHTLQKQGENICKPHTLDFSDH